MSRVAAAAGIGAGVAHACLLVSILLAVLSQLLMRWQADQASLPAGDTGARLYFIVQMLLQPFVLLAICCTFLSGVCWMVALTRFELTYAMPFAALSFVLTPAAAALLFGESYSAGKLLGTLLIMAGLVLAARG